MQDLWGEEISQPNKRSSSTAKQSALSLTAKDCFFLSQLYPCGQVRDSLTGASCSRVTRFPVFTSFPRIEATVQYPLYLEREVTYLLNEIVSQP